MSNLKGLHHFCAMNNPSGLIKIEYAPINDIDTNSFEEIRSSSNNWQYNILFLQGGWLKANILPTRRLWRETQSRNKQGKYYNQMVRAIVPNLIPDASGELDRMADHRFILKIEDIAGRPWILGTLNQPFEFTVDGTTGENGSLKHHTINFKSKSLRKAAGFVPLFNI